MTRRIVGWAALAACVLTASPATAQQRPLVTEDPEVIGAGLILLEGGFDYSREILFPRPSKTSRRADEKSWAAAL